jgi:hypothetical protein
MNSRDLCPGRSVQRVREICSSRSLMPWLVRQIGDFGVQIGRLRTLNHRVPGSSVSGTAPNRAFLPGFPATQFADFGLCERSCVCMTIFGASSLHPKIPFPAAVLSAKFGPGPALKLLGPDVASRCVVREQYREVRQYLNVLRYRNSGFRAGLAAIPH